MADKKDLDVKLLGLTVGDKIQFTQNSLDFEISSVTKTLMLDNKGEEGGKYWSIRALTRKLRNGDLPEDLDVWSLWTCQGKTLRNINEGNNS